MTTFISNAADVPDIVPTPLGAYLAVVIRNNIGYVSGQFPIVEGNALLTGRLGVELDVAQGKSAARFAALNVLGQIKKAMQGDLSRIALARVDGVIASIADFTQLPQVLDGASETFVEILGERGKHARSILPVTSLPNQMPVQLVVTFHILQQKNI
jgi:enamine deaminase RidA (YjgF/YER057c/UK114 family)